MKPIVQTPLEEIRQAEQSEKQLKETVAQLEATNAALSYEVMMKEAAIEDLQSQHSVLVYELMTKGVIQNA